MKPLRFRSPALPLLPSVLLVFLIAACGSPFTDAPPVADSTFVSTLAELHLAEARLSAQQHGRRGRARRRHRPDTMAVPLPPALRDSILARHDMSYPQLRAALDYYVKRPEQYAELYGRVVDTLSAERKAFSFGSERPGTPPSEHPTPPAFRKDRD